MTFDHDGNLWVGTKARDFFVSMEMRWTITDRPKAYPAIL